MNKKRKPNTNECTSFGRNLSDIYCDDIETSKGYVVIGSENDGSIYFGKSLDNGEDTLKERVKITFLYEPEEGEGFTVDIDLEDVLRFAAKYCKGIYNRVLSESEQ